MRRFFFLLCASLLAFFTGTARADFQISSLSSRPDMVSGGNVLVGIDIARHAPGDVRVALNGVDVSGAFQAQSDGSLLGLVSGLALGANRLVAVAHGRGGDDRDGITLTNYPVEGPIFSGPHETPFICMTAQFALPATTATLGAALDSNCSAATPGGLRLSHHRRHFQAAARRHHVSVRPGTDHHLARQDRALTSCGSRPAPSTAQSTRPRCCTTRTATRRPPPTRRRRPGTSAWSTRSAAAASAATTSRAARSATAASSRT